MSTRALQGVIGEMVVNKQFCQQVLQDPNGRAILLKDFDLTAEEAALLNSIHATSLPAFAAKVDHWISYGKDRVTIPFLPSLRLRVNTATV
jgi:hypothetical protein